MQSSWKIYAVLFVIMIVMQSQFYRKHLRQSLNSPQSIQPLTTYELVMSATFGFFAFVIIEALIKNEVF